MHLPRPRTDGFRSATPTVLVPLLGLAVILAIAAIASRSDAQQADPNFPVTNGAVIASVLEGNTLYIGGQFSWVGPATGGFVALDQTTAERVPGWPRVTGYVQAAIADGLGGWYVGGTFTSINGAPRANLAHIRADGTLDGWNPGADAAVWVMVRSGSTLYLGGDFTTLGGQPRNYIGALDLGTAVATAWDPNASWVVRALVVDGSTVFAAGGFNMIGGQSRNGLAAIDAGSGAVTTWDPAATQFGSPAQVDALALDGSTLYVGSRFDFIGGQNRNGLAALDVATGAATAWNPNAMGPYFGGSVSTLAVSGSLVYAGGFYVSIGGQARSNLAAIDASTGLATSWSPDPDGDVISLSVHGSRVYASGFFSSIGGEPRFGFAALDAASGLASAWDPKAHGGSVVGVNGSVVFLSGSVGGAARPGLAAIDVTTGLVTPWNPNAGSSPLSLDLALAASGNTIYVAGFFGYFPTIGGVPRNGIAAIDATTGAVLPWDPAPDSYATNLAIDGSTVYTSGYFTTIGGQPRAGIAALDAGSGLATLWDPGPIYAGGALAVSGSTVYAGGGPPSWLYALDAGTGLPSAWDPAADSFVRTIVSSGSTVYASGYFGNLGGQPRLFTGAVDALTGLATPWDPSPNDPAPKLLVSGSTVYAGGAFTFIGGQSRSAIAALDATTGLASAWNPDAAGYNSVGALAADASRVYAGGGFSTICGQILPFLAAIDRADPTPISASVVSANGGEMLIIGAHNPLHWTASGGRGIAGVDLYLSRSGPSGPWELIAAGVSNTGSYDWIGTGPAVAGNAFLRVDAHDWAGTAGSDLSDAAFSISEIATPTLVELFRAESAADGVHIEWKLSDPSLVANAAPERGASETGAWSRVSGAVEERSGISTVIDREPAAAGTTWYRLAGVWRDGRQFTTAPVPVTLVGAVAAFELSPVAPNPTRGVSQLAFAVPSRSRVQISLVDVQGRQVAKLADGVREPGRYTTLLDAGDLRAGLYFVRMQAPGTDLRRRIAIIR